MTSEQHRPYPSQLYLRRSEEEPACLIHPQRLLVILDLNGTLLFRKQHPGYKETIPRPGVENFLEYLFQNHAVMVWGSAQPQNVEKMCKTIMSQRQIQDLVAIWTRDHLRLPPQLYASKAQVYKQLSWLWDNESMQRQGAIRDVEWNQTNTVLVDNSSEKGTSEPYNIIELATFDETQTAASMANASDFSSLIEYLDDLKLQANVSSYIRRHPYQ